MLMLWKSYIFAPGKRKDCIILSIFGAKVSKNFEIRNNVNTSNYKF